MKRNLCGDVFVAPSISEEDELYEEYVCETNLVFEAVGDKLIEVEKYSRKPLRYCLLQSRKVRFTDVLLLCPPLAMLFRVGWALEMNCLVCEMSHFISPQNLHFQISSVSE